MLTFLSAHTQVVDQLIHLIIFFLFFNFLKHFPCSKKMRKKTLRYIVHGYNLIMNFLSVVCIPFGRRWYSIPHYAVFRSGHDHRLIVKSVAIGKQVVQNLVKL